MNIAGLVYLIIMALVIGFMIYSRVKQNKENKSKEEKEQLKKKVKKSNKHRR